MSSDRKVLYSSNNILDALQECNKLKTCKCIDNAYGNNKEQWNLYSLDDIKQCMPTYCMDKTFSGKYTPLAFKINK